MVAKNQTKAGRRNVALSLNKPKLDNLASDIWKSAERLRGKFKSYEYQSVILPIIVIRRLECVLIDWRSKKAAEILKNVTYVKEMDEVAEGCDALVIATEWPVFKKLDLERARKALTHPILFDGRNLFDPQEMEKHGFIYKSIGR